MWILKKWVFGFKKIIKRFFFYKPIPPGGLLQSVKTLRLKNYGKM